MTNRWMRVGGILTFFCICFAIGDILAQQPGIIQTDPKDIGHRQKIDRDVGGQIAVVDRQTQADTLVLTDGNTADTVYLDNKYMDTNYMVFIMMRNVSGAWSNHRVIPLSDSSFKITKSSTDAGTVQWMTIHK